MFLGLIAAFVATPMKVEVVPVGSGWELRRDGKPYFIRGVGGTDRMDDLRKAGGNSMRGWGVDNAATELDAMLAKGITYTVGIWLGHKSYFNYSNPAQVSEQKAKVREAILRHRLHPAVLMWGLGNEMEMDNDTPALWMAIGELAKMAKELDPNHPVTTVVAEISDQKIANIKRYAPDIDVLGINSYGGMPTLADRLKKAGWTKPYVVTEFGPLGPWERPKTEWGAALEPNSTEKAEFYRNSYDCAIANQPQCLGSYAFLWGHKQEETPTWFGMFLPTGEKTAAVDIIAHAWTGKWPSLRAPEIRRFDVPWQGKTVIGGTELAASVAAIPASSASYEWRVMRETIEKKYAGEGEQKPAFVKTAVNSMNRPSVSFSAPKEPGTYRLYLTIRDGKGGAAVANAPFRIANG